MTDNNSVRFSGVGEEQQLGAWKDLPKVNPEELRDPKKYVASEDLATAVNVALTLGMPLLLTGEPGSGKSQLAYRLAWELGFPSVRDGEPVGKPLKFAIKSTTEARDLFYLFDTVGRFHAATIAKESEKDEKIAAENFIEYQALGLAILNAIGKTGLREIKDLKLTDSQWKSIGEEPRRTVVLLDEIDKARRDVPNDILNEIEEMSFKIPELKGVEVKLKRNERENRKEQEDPDEQANRPVVIITSNSERDLPEAFLRRCVFHHVRFPPFDDEMPKDASERKSRRVSVRRIVDSRFGERFVSSHGKFFDDALKVMQHLRKQRQKLSKPPSLAELLNWLDLLRREHLGNGTEVKRLKDVREVVRESIALTLLKSEADHEQIDELLKGCEVL